MRNALAAIWYLLWVVPTIVVLVWQDASYQTAIGATAVATLIGFAGAFFIAEVAGK